VSHRPAWTALARWLKFNVIGAVGIVVQVTLLWMLMGAGLGYMLATGLAVEAAVLHNFIWHERYTWMDRTDGTVHDSIARLLRFNTTTGAVSVAGNLLIMRLLVGATHLRPVFANLISIAACSVINFFVSDRWVFRGVAKAQ